MIEFHKNGPTLLYLFAPSIKLYLWPYQVTSNHARWNQLEINRWNSAQCPVFLTFPRCIDFWENLFLKYTSFALSYVNCISFISRPDGYTVVPQQTLIFFFYPKTNQAAQTMKKKMHFHFLWYKLCSIFLITQNIHNSIEPRTE